MDRLPRNYQGFAYIFGGIAVALYALGILGSGITVLIVALAVCSIIIGCGKLGLFEKLPSWLHRRRR